MSYRDPFEGGRPTGDELDDLREEAEERHDEQTDEDDAANETGSTDNPSPPPTEPPERVQETIERRESGNTGLAGGRDDDTDTSGGFDSGTDTDDSSGTDPDRADSDSGSSTSPVPDDIATTGPSSSNPSDTAQSPTSPSSPSFSPDPSPSDSDSSGSGSDDGDTTGSDSDNSASVPDDIADTGSSSGSGTDVGDESSPSPTEPPERVEETIERRESGNTGLAGGRDDDTNTSGGFDSDTDSDDSSDPSGPTEDVSSETPTETRSGSTDDSSESQFQPPSEPDDDLGVAIDGPTERVEQQARDLKSEVLEETGIDSRAGIAVRLEERDGQPDQLVPELTDRGETELREQATEEQVAETFADGSPQGFDAEAAASEAVETQVNDAGDPEVVIDDWAQEAVQTDRQVDAIEDAFGGDDSGNSSGTSTSSEVPDDIAQIGAGQGRVEDSISGEIQDVERLEGIDDAFEVRVQTESGIEERQVALTDEAQAQLQNRRQRQRERAQEEMQRELEGVERNREATQGIRDRQQEIEARAAQEDIRRQIESDLNTAQAEAAGAAAARESGPEFDDSFAGRVNEAGSAAIVGAADAIGTVVSGTVDVADDVPGLKQAAESISQAEADEDITESATTGGLLDEGERRQQIDSPEPVSVPESINADMSTDEAREEVASANAGVEVEDVSVSQTADALDVSVDVDATDLRERAAAQADGVSADQVEIVAGDSGDPQFVAVEETGAQDGLFQGSIISEITGVTERSLDESAENFITTDINQYIETDEGGVPDAQEAPGEQALEGTAQTLVSLFNVPAAVAGVEDAADALDPGTGLTVAQNLDTAGETVLATGRDKTTAATTFAGENPGRATGLVGAGVVTGGASLAGSGLSSGSLARQLSAEFDPTNSVGISATRSAVRGIRSDGTGDVETVSGRGPRSRQSDLQTRRGETTDRPGVAPQQSSDPATWSRPTASDSGDRSTSSTDTDTTEGVPERGDPEFEAATQDVVDEMFDDSDVDTPQSDVGGEFDPFAGDRGQLDLSQLLDRSGSDSTTEIGGSDIDPPRRGPSVRTPGDAPRNQGGRRRGGSRRSGMGSSQTRGAGSRTGRSGPRGGNPRLRDDSDTGQSFDDRDTELTDSADTGDVDATVPGSASSIGSGAVGAGTSLLGDAQQSEVAESVTDAQQAVDADQLSAIEQQTQESVFMSPDIDAGFGPGAQQGPDVFSGTDAFTGTDVGVDTDQRADIDTQARSRLDIDTRLDLDQPMDMDQSSDLDQPVDRDRPDRDTPPDRDITDPDSPFDSDGPSDRDRDSPFEREFEALGEQDDGLGLDDSSEMFDTGIASAEDLLDDS